MNTRILLLTAGLALAASALHAQNRFDALRYGNYQPSDPTSVVLNPASAALTSHSYFRFSLGNREVDEDGTFRATTTGFNDNQAAISDLQFVVKMPTLVGSMVFGAGYTQLTDFNKAWSAGAYNPDNSIMDYVIGASDQYFLPAFNTYAIDTVGGEYYTVYELAGFGGIDQYIETYERGQMGEYNIHFATEFQKNLFLGASIGLPAGHYSYKRSFLEEDIDGIYTQSPDDIDAIIVDDRIDATIRGFNARLGLLYKPAANASVGVSYTTRTRLSIDEVYSTRFQTEFKTLDAYEDTYEGEINYTVSLPSRVAVTGTYDAGPFAVAAAVERVNYGRIEMDGLGPRIGREENSAIRTEFRDVLNWQVNASFNMGNLKPRFGYALQSAPTQAATTVDTQYMSGGFAIDLGSDMVLDLGVRYNTTEGREVLYGFGSTTEAVDRTGTKWFTSVGLKIGF